MSDPKNSSPARTDAELDDLLAELGRASEDIAPSADFKRAIARAIDDEIAQQQNERPHNEQPRAPRPAPPASWLDSIAGGGRFAVVAAAAAAALSLWWSSEVQGDFDDEVLATFDVVEVVE